MGQEVTHETCNFINAMVPKDYNNATTVVKYISMKGYRYATFVATTGTMAGSLAVLIKKATAIAGTNAENATVTKMWTNDATPTTDALVETAVTANTFDLDVAQSTYVVEIDAATLGLNATSGLPNDCILFHTVCTANANLVSCVCILSNSRYQSAPNPEPNPLLD